MVQAIFPYKACKTPYIYPWHSEHGWSSPCTKHMNSNVWFRLPEILVSLLMLNQSLQCCSYEFLNHLTYIMLLCISHAFIHSTSICITYCMYHSILEPNITYKACSMIHSIIIHHCTHILCTPALIHTPSSFCIPADAILCPWQYKCMYK